MVDFQINFQKIRHSYIAQLIRKWIYRSLIGADNWPIVFRQPTSYKDIPKETSSNLYVHLPFCEKICPHCPYNKTLYKRKLHKSYGKALERELHNYLKRPKVPQVNSVYFGGGTPSITPDLIEMVMDYVRPLLAEKAEVGVEVYPTHAQKLLLESLRNLGVNRISLGIETLRKDLLDTLGRTYSPNEAIEATKTTCQIGFDCVDVNLIYGIPGQDINESSSDAEHCLALGIDQISAYPLFTFIHTSLGKQVNNGRFSIYGDRARLLTQKAISKVCRDKGFLRTSVWSFTRPGVAPYSTVTKQDYIGFGAGAGSKVNGVFWFNTFSVESYINSKQPQPALVLNVGKRFLRLHWLYWQVYRTEIDPAQYRILFDRDLLHDFGILLFLFKVLGWSYYDDTCWRMTERGAVWAHRIQSLYSLTYIDKLWTHCQKEPWPEEVILT